jgi:hypothetical protein
MTNKILLGFEILFGCWHLNVSRPFTISGSTYEVCLNCGRKFEYDFAELGGVVTVRERAARISAMPSASLLPGAQS